MQTIVKLLGGCSQIIGGDISPHPPGFGTTDYDVIDWSDYQREKNIIIPKHDFCGNNYWSKNDSHRILEVHISLPTKNG